MTAEERLRMWICELYQQRNMDLVDDALMEAGRIADERFKQRLRSAVDDRCLCGGRGPNDPDVCDACVLWHEVTK